MANFPAYRMVARRTAVVLALVALGAAGCGDAEVEPAGEAPVTRSVETTGSTPASTRSQPVPSTSTSIAFEVKVFFADADAQKLVAQSRTGSADSMLRFAMLELAKGPDGGGAMAALPAGTEIVGTSVADGEAQLNFSKAFADGYPKGGAAAEFAVLAPIVFTATALPGVDWVRIKVEGQTPELTGSQYDWSRLFSRADFPEVDG